MKKVKDNRIAILLLAREKGGVEGRFLVLLKYLLLNHFSENIKIDFYISRSLFKKSDILINNNIPNNIKVILYGSSINGNNKILRYYDYITFFISSFFRKQQYSTVHFVSLSSLLFYKLFKKTNVKVVSFVNSASIEKNADLKTFKNISTSKFIVDCLDERIAKTLASHKNFQNHDLQVSPCSFIDYESTDCNWHDKENLITFCGRLIDIKGIEILLPALNKIIERNPNYKMFIMGKGDLGDDIKKFIEKSNISDKVEVFYAKDPLKFLKRSKIFLSLQKFENYPSQSLLQAMSTKNAIIATNVGLTSKIVNKENGVLIDYESNSLAFEVNNLIADKENLKSKAERARFDALNNHQVEKYFNYLLNLYKS